MIARSEGNGLPRREAIASIIALGSYKVPALTLGTNQSRKAWRTGFKEPVAEGFCASDLAYLLDGIVANGSS